MAKLIGLIAIMVIVFASVLFASWIIGQGLNHQVDVSTEAVQ